MHLFVQMPMIIRGWGFQLHIVFNYALGVGIAIYYVTEECKIDL